MLRISTCYKELSEINTCKIFRDLKRVFEFKERKVIIPPQIITRLVALLRCQKQHGHNACQMDCNIPGIFSVSCNYFFLCLAVWCAFCESFPHPISKWASAFLPLAHRVRCRPGISTLSVLQWSLKDFYVACMWL